MLVSAHFRCAADPYDAATNPRGYLNLGTAENYLAWDLLRDDLTALPPVTAGLTHYDFLFGSRELRERVAALMGELAERPLDPENVIVAAGTSAILDILAFTLCGPGEAIAIPTPYYAGFDQDLTLRAQATVWPIPLSAETGFAITPEALASGLEAARAAGVTVRALLVTSPHNPTGQVLTRECLDGLLALAEAHDVELIVDEIYARSVFGSRPFTSVLSLTAPRRERLHVAYGFAKDFAMSGFKVGVLYTESPALRDVARQLALLAAVSTQTQATLAHLLSDPARLGRYSADNRVLLARSAEAARAGLEALGVPCLTPQAGLFVWANFGAWLAEPTFEAEAELARRFFDEAKLNLSPGAGFHCAEPGWFRLCFARPVAELEVAFERLAHWRSERPLSLA